MTYIHGVTSLGGFPLRPNFVCLRLPPEHSFHNELARSRQNRQHEVQL
jgi:hypothetical protein